MLSYLLLVEKRRAPYSGGLMGVCAGSAVSAAGRDEKETADKNHTRTKRHECVYECVSVYECVWVCMWEAGGCKKRNSQLSVHCWGDLARPSWCTATLIHTFARTYAHTKISLKLSFQYWSRQFTMHYTFYNCVCDLRNIDLVWIRSSIDYGIMNNINQQFFFPLKFQFDRRAANLDELRTQPYFEVYVMLTSL